MAVRRTLVQRSAEALLVKHGIESAPVPVDVIAAREGATIVYVEADSDLSGFLYRQGAGGTVIGVNRTESPPRRRFTIAHEIGHLLLHASQRVHVDKTATVFHRGPSSSQGVNEHEVEANLFAAELLMPRQMLEADVRSKGYVDHGDDAQVKDLAKRYGVSAQAMSIRLASLGWVTL
jgi:Zn-dependent peptidase ImmA (M78 family)